MKHILILLGLLLFSMQLHARGTDNPVPEDGSREHPYLIEMSHGCEPYVHSGVYNEGYTAKLYLYYRLEVKDAPVIINLSSYSNVPLVTGIQMETGEELASAHVSDIGGGTGRIDKFPLMPGVYTILQSTHTHDVHITLTVEETLPPLPGGGDDKEEPDIDEPDSIDPYTPTQSMSYVRTLIPNESAQTKEELLLKGKSRHLIRYYDPLGRPFEEVARKASAAKEDVVALRTYDAFGRIHRQWLPVPSQNNGLALSPLVVSSRARSFYKDSATFSLSLYDGSPLGRLTEEYGPGSAWHSAGRSRKSHYRLSTEADKCLRLRVSGGSESPLLLPGGFYPPLSLAVTEHLDEDGKRAQAFTDRFGREVLHRRLSESDTLDTYRVYDDLGNLCFVLPPLACDSLASSPETALEKYAFQYRYDYRQRLIGKKLPGCAWTEFVYDRNHRLVFSQDGVQRSRGEYSFHFSDLLGRSVLEGICKGALPHRAACDAVNLYAVFAPEAPEAVEGYLAFLPEGMSAGGLKVTEARYYDNYSYSSLPGFDSRLEYEEAEGYGIRYAANDSIHCKDLLTGSLEVCRETGAKACTARYYDFHRRMIQERHVSPDGTLEVRACSYTFNGMPLNSSCRYGKGAAVSERRTYDHGGRLVEQLLLQGGDSVRFTYGYNPTGLLVSRRRIHGDTVSVSFEYDLRGQLKKQSSPAFHQTLHYTDGTGVPCYNGNISSLVWRNGSDDLLRGYRFSYDGFDRLLKASYGEGGNLAEGRERFSEAVGLYDKQGNILNLQRYGRVSEGGYGLLDNLRCVPDGNRLLCVDDAVTAPAYGDGFEFRDGASLPAEYSYDANGNLTQDLNRGILEIQYNYLNLPIKVVFSDGSTLSHAYLADGTKFRTVHIADGDTTTTDYHGNAVYENGTPKLLIMEEGYFTLPDGKFHDFHKDHLGNVRAVTDEEGRLEEVNDYYPFGGLMATSTPGVQPRKYNGKELESHNGLNWYDYGARRYDPVLGWFTTVDPSSESYYSWSPYGYCYDNPVRYVDPTGRWIETLWDAYSLTMGADSFKDNLSEGNYGLAFVDGVGVLCDAASLVLPGVPAVAGATIKTAKTAGKFDNAGDGLKLKAMERGRRNEAKVLESIGEVKNTKWHTVQLKDTKEDVTVIPDAVTETEIIEIKDTKNVYNTKQIRAERQLAEKSGKKFVIITGEKTHVSGKVKDAIIIRRKDIGPQ